MDSMFADGFLSQSQRMESFSVYFVRFQDNQKTAGIGQAYCLL